MSVSGGAGGGDGGKTNGFVGFLSIFIFTGPKNAQSPSFASYIKYTCSTATTASRMRRIFTSLAHHTPISCILSGFDKVNGPRST